MSSPSFVPQKYHISVEEYDKLGELGIYGPEARVELLDGVVLTLHPINVRHAHAVSTLFEPLVDQHHGRYFVSPGSPIWLHEYSEPQPDLMLVPRVRKLTRHPRPEDVFLLVEVSDASLAYDREQKLAAYASAQVREFWIVNLQEDVIEVFRQPEDGKYTVELHFGLGETVRPLAFEDVVVQVEEIIPPR